MDSKRARDLYREYAGAMAYVEVRGPDGHTSIGTAFHVGAGVFVTARHVVEGKKITEVATTVPYPLRPRERFYSVQPKVVEVVDGPYFHSDQSVDVAVFRADWVDPLTPSVELGLHLDRWITDDAFILEEAIVLGYPPIPMTNEPRLVAARAEVNAVVRLRHLPHTQFVLSAMARGGFSGGIALSEKGYVLGMVTESLLRDALPAELGFMSILGVEPIFACTAAHGLADFEGASWNNPWQSLTCHRLVRVPRRTDQSLMSATVRVFDDDHDIWLEVECPSPTALAEAVSAIRSVAGRINVHKRGESTAFIVPQENPPMKVLQEAGRAATRALHSHGYVAIRPRSRNADNVE